MLQLDYRDATPIYLQIKNSIIQSILLGEYNPGESLPSVRAMATQLGLNPNTVQKAYQELENEGIIASVAGKGSFIQDLEHAKNKQTEQIRKQVKELAISAKSAGLGLKDLSALMEEAFKEMNP